MFFCCYSMYSAFGDKRLIFRIYFSFVLLISTFFLTERITQLTHNSNLKRILLIEYLKISKNLVLETTLNI